MLKKSYLEGSPSHRQGFRQKKPTQHWGHFSTLSDVRSSPHAGTPLPRRFTITLKHVVKIKKHNGTPRHQILLGATYLFSRGCDNPRSCPHPSTKQTFWHLLQIQGPALRSRGGLRPHGHRVCFEQRPEIMISSNPNLPK